MPNMLTLALNDTLQDRGRIEVMKPGCWQVRCVAARQSADGSLSISVNGNVLELDRLTALDLKAAMQTYGEAQHTPEF